MKTSKRQLKDVVYDLLVEPSKEKFREFIIGNTGETNSIDFKTTWIEKDQLSKLMIAMANSGGGLVVFGVRENEDGTNEPVGINKIKDPSEINDMIGKYVPVTLKYEILNFVYESSEYENLIGKKFQILEIEDAPESLPFISLSAGKDIDKDIIYIRRGTKCEKAKAEEIERIINRRIETQYSSSSVLELNDHINQLEVLYSSIDKNKKSYSFKNYGAFFEALSNPFGMKHEVVPNPSYPEEEFDEFISRMIDAKKRKIEIVLELR